VFLGLYEILAPFYIIVVYALLVTVYAITLMSLQATQASGATARKVMRRLTPVNPASFRKSASVKAKGGPVRDWRGSGGQIVVLPPAQAVRIGKGKNVMLYNIWLNREVSHFVRADIELASGSAVVNPLGALSVAKANVAPSGSVVT
jgi:hypothetical protein